MPLDVQPLLEFIANSSNRNMTGIRNDNIYLFANTRMFAFMLRYFSTSDSPNYNLRIYVSVTLWLIPFICILRSMLCMTGSLCLTI